MDFHVRDEIHALAWKLSDACTGGKVDRVKEILAYVDTWREHGSANEFEATIWIGALRTSQNKPCAGPLSALLEQITGEWVNYARTLRAEGSSPSR